MMTSAPNSLKLLLAYQRVAAFLSNPAKERSELGAVSKESLSDIEALQPKTPITH